MTRNKTKIKDNEIALVALFSDNRARKLVKYTFICLMLDCGQLAEDYSLCESVE